MQIPGPASPPLGQPPQEITDFLDRLHANRQQIIPGSLIWLPHPTKPFDKAQDKPGRLVPGVRVEPTDKPFDKPFD